MPSSHQRRSLPFTVAIPIASRDRHGQPVPAGLRREWESRTVSFLTGCFGGATVVRATGQVRMADGWISVEVGQRVVVSGSSSVREYRRHRKRIEAFAAEMKLALDQESICVLPFPWSHSYILE